MTDFMRIFDLHCDTPYEMKKRNLNLNNDCLHISASKLNDVEKYVQIMAIWSDNELSDEDCYSAFFEIYKHFRKDSDFVTGKVPENGGFYLSVEDSRLLCGDITRLDILYDLGLRFLIPTWKGESCIGGAFDTSTSLTDFGRSVIKRCFEKNIVVDISHCSEESADDIFGLAEAYNKPVIASHSCSYSVYPHERNLRDCQFERIKELGGIVGLSFCSYHLTSKDKLCTVQNILEHIEKYLSLGGENILCLGGDLDGASLPSDVNGIDSYSYIYEHLEKRYGKNISDKIFYKNAEKFVNSIF